jgi:hypothetical protein
MQTFAAYSAAKAAAERLVRERAAGSQAAALTASGDYLDALGRINVPLSAASRPSAAGTPTAG